MERLATRVEHTAMERLAARIRLPPASLAVLAVAEAIVFPRHGAQAIRDRLATLMAFGVSARHAAALIDELALWIVNCWERRLVVSFGEVASTERMGSMWPWGWAAFRTLADELAA